MHVERYAYDKAGNMTKKALLRCGHADSAKPPTLADYAITTFAFDGANQLVSSTTDGVTTKYAYDAAGRLVKEGNKTYCYGYLDKVLSVTEGERKYTYDYHVDGQLARANYGNGRGAGCPQPAGIEDFLWDGLALIKRGDERFVNEPHVGGGNPVASSKGTTYFNDMLGTTVGAKNDRKYTPAALTAFGETFQTFQTAKHQTSQTFFTGKPEIAGLGHTFLFRNYRASLAKWQTADPLGYPDGWNQLAYCNNCVVFSLDSFGACKTCVNCGPGCPCLVAHYYYPEWFHNGNQDNLYCLGRDGFPILNPNHPIANAIEDYFPSAHYFAVVHDSWIDALNPQGIWDYVINVPSMPVAYLFSFGANAYDSFLDLLKLAQDGLGLNVVNIDDLRINPIVLYQCECKE